MKFNDMYEYQIKKCEWREINLKKKSIPEARTFHTLNSFENEIFLFGGSSSNKLNDLHRIKIHSNFMGTVAPGSPKSKETTPGTQNEKSETFGLSSDISVTFSYLDNKSFASVQTSKEENLDSLEVQIKLLRRQADDLSQRLENEKNRSLCFICYMGQCDAVFLDCGHKISCFKCGSVLEKCPICRRKIKEVIQVNNNA